MYKKGLSAQDKANMTLMGLSDADYAADEDVDVWPENWDAVLLFDAIGTQWLVGPNGPYGLNYLVLYQRMDRMKLTPERYQEMEDQIRILEGAALEEMRKD
jgi:hypothetical protein